MAKMQFSGTAVNLRAFMAKIGTLSENAREKWKYLGFDEIGWKVILAENNTIIVVDETLNLDSALVFTDPDDFIIWLEKIDIQQ